MTQTNSLLNAALDYAALGWSVHPLWPSMKEPFTKQGFKDATADPDAIRLWWERNPDLNIGLATDDQRFFVLDIDGPEGKAGLAGLESRFGKLPETLVAETGHGFHYIFRYSGTQKLGNTAGRAGKRLGKNIDTRGTGGYIVAPPSIHPDGGTYRWLNWGTPLAELPEWVVTKLKEVEVAWKVQPQYSTNKQPQVRRTWETCCLNLAQASSGSRNHTLNESAFTMGGWIASNSISREEVESGLRIIGLQVGLTESEIEKTLASGIESGMQQPIYPKEKEALPHESKSQHQARVTTGKVEIRRGSSFGRNKVQFFWHNRIPLGKLTIIAGQGGIGKSFLTLSLAAHVTAGTVLMDTNGQTLNGEALFCSYEDDVEDTIGPRADELGVDLDKCHFITGVNTEHGQRDFGPQDVEVITDYLKQCPDIKLIVIDPLASFMGGAGDMNAEAQTRGVLQTLVKTAQRTGTAIVVVAHLRKSLSEEDPIHRISGSVGITNISRSVLMVERDSEDKTRRWVRQLKHNYSKPAPDISYSFVDNHFSWLGVKYTPEDNADFVRITLDCQDDDRMKVETIFDRGKMHGRTAEDISQGFEILRDKGLLTQVQEGNGWFWQLQGI